MNTTMLFMSIPELKTKLGVSTIDIVKNPNTGKLFGATTNGNLKVEQAITPDLPIKFMYEPDKFAEGCIVNVTPANKPILSL